MPILLLAEEGDRASLQNIISRIWEFQT